MLDTNLIFLAEGACGFGLGSGGLGIRVQDFLGVPAFGFRMWGYGKECRGLNNES